LKHSPLLSDRFSPGLCSPVLISTCPSWMAR
jgi:hypothetical protein